MILGYKIPNAEPYIIHKRKIHTFRIDKGNRWKPGRTIQHATGVRSKQYRCFMQSTCTGTQRAVLSYAGARLMLYIGGRKMSERQVAEFVYNDGLESVLQLINFLFPTNKSGIRKIKTVSGNIIHWTEKRYY